MAKRPETAASTISSTISEYDDGSKPPFAGNPLSAMAYAPSPRRYQYNQATQPQSVFKSRVSASGGRPSTNLLDRAQSPLDKVNKSHVPSLTAQGFSRPMSSQKLQAQRSGRPPTAVTQPSVSVLDTPIDVETERSSSTAQKDSHAPMSGRDHAPPNLPTNFPDRMSENQATSGNHPVSGTGEKGDSRWKGDERRGVQNLHAQLKPESESVSPNFASRFSRDSQPRSPRSFRTGFNFKNNRDAQVHVGTGPREPHSEDSVSRHDLTKPPVAEFEKQKSGKNYEYFEGNTIFFWGGRFQNARDRPVNIATGLILTLPAVLFFIFSAPWLWHNVSPAIPLVFAYFFFVCLSSFIHASIIDPGIYPRNVHPFPPADDNDDPLSIGPATNDWVMIRLATSETAAIDFPIKYCKTCNIWRPPRCYHCRVCDNCVETLDHHCVWLNNCVGRRNYRYFFTFVSSATLLGLYLIGASLGHCLAYRAQQGLNFTQAINQCRVPFAMFIYGVLATPYPGSLWIYHLFLMGRGETTREYLTSHKFLKADRHRPFTQGNFFKNWIAVLGRPRPPTYLHFKQKYEEGDQRFGSRKGRRQAPLVEAAKNGGLEMKPMQKAFEGPTGKNLKSEEAG